MEQLEILWKYQELDLQMDQYSLEQKNSDLRKKLLKLRDYLVKQDEYLGKLDNEAVRKNSFYNKIQNECDSISNTIKTEMEKLKAGEITEVSDLEDMSRASMALRDRLNKKEEELKRLLKEIEAFQKKLNDIRLKVTKAKKEYAEVKKAYDQEMLKLKQDRDKVKEQRDSLGGGIDKTLLAKYKNIKASKSPVISLMDNNQCGGCFMSLASLVVQNVKDGKRIVECENCGRILYYKS
jgi:predicted  nucleic acid-binding Zn-ribbon protein